MKVKLYREYPEICLVFLVTMEVMCVSVQAMADMELNTRFVDNLTSENPVTYSDIFYYITSHFLLNSDEETK